MFTVKVITQSDPVFLKTVYKHGHLIDLQNDDRFIDTGEKYIIYQNCMWKVYQKNKTNPKVLIGSYKHIFSAMFCARGGRLR